MANAALLLAEEAHGGSSSIAGRRQEGTPPGFSTMVRGCAAPQDGAPQGRNVCALAVLRRRLQSRPACRPPRRLVRWQSLSLYAFSAWPAPSIADPFDWDLGASAVEVLAADEAGRRALEKTGMLV